MSSELNPLTRADFVRQICADHRITFKAGKTIATQALIAEELGRHIGHRVTIDSRPCVTAIRCETCSLPSEVHMTISGPVPCGKPPGFWGRSVLEEADTK